MVKLNLSQCVKNNSGYIAVRINVKTFSHFYFLPPTYEPRTKLVLFYICLFHYGFILPTLRRLPA